MKQDDTGPRPPNVRVPRKRTSSSLEANWSKVKDDDVCAYNVQIFHASLPFFNGDGGSSVRVEECSYKFAGLDSFTRYGLRVQSINSQGETGPWSNAVHQRTLPTTRERVALVSGTYCGITIITPCDVATSARTKAAECAGKNIENKRLKEVAKTMAGCCAGMCGCVVGCIAAPVFGVVAAYKCFKCTSADEDDEQKHILSN